MMLSLRPCCPALCYFRTLKPMYNSATLWIGHTCQNTTSG
jgi:hypothetical protein